MNIKPEEIGEDMPLTDLNISEKSNEQLLSRIKVLEESQDDMKLLLNLMKKVLAVNPKARKQLVEHLGGVISHKVHGYYNEKSASFLYKAFSMLQEKDVDFVTFSYSDYKQMLSKSSLRQLIFYGKKYLIENMEQEYPEFYAVAILCDVKVRDGGVVLMKRDQPRLMRAGSASQLGSNASVNPIGWKQPMLEFLENSIEGAKFSMKDLLLSPEDIQFVRDTLDESDEFDYTVDSNKIKIIHLTKKDIEANKEREQNETNSEVSYQ